jgi:hypothetical protein
VKRGIRPIPDPGNQAGFEGMVNIIAVLLIIGKVKGPGKPF